MASKIERVPLPSRGRDRTIVIDPAALDEVRELLTADDFPVGEALIVNKLDSDGKPYTTDGRARTYARMFADAYQLRFPDDVTMEDDDTPRRILSTHAIEATGQNGKPNGKWIAAVSMNTRDPYVRTNPGDGPSRSELMREARDWRKAHPRDRTFRNYTRWDYDTLRERVNEVTGYNDGIYQPPPADEPANNGTAPADTAPDNTDAEAPANAPA